MKCPKCGYVTFDHLDACNKCSTDLTERRALLGMPDYEPNVPGFLAQVAAAEGEGPGDVAAGGMEIGDDTLMVEEPALEEDSLIIGDEAPEAEEPPEMFEDAAEEPDLSLEPETEPAEEESEPLDLEPEPLMEEEPSLDLDLEEEPAEEEGPPAFTDEELSIDDSAIEDIGDLDIDVGDEELDLAAEAPAEEPPEVPGPEDESLEIPDLEDEHLEIPDLEEEPEEPPAPEEEKKPETPEEDLGLDEDALKDLDIDLDDLEIEE